MKFLVHKLAQVLDTHFDAKWGAPYWIERRKLLGFDPRLEVRQLEDLPRLGPMPLGDLARRPIEEFIPRKYYHEMHRLVLSETGGTTGPAKRTAFLPEEFEAGFVAPFLHAAKHLNFPEKRHWLYLGPTGPHIVGKAVRACALALGSIEPFCVDFDPRWARKLAPDSMARKRYTEHIVEQAMAILDSNRIGVLFATPPLLEILGERVSDAIRESIVGIHLGGMAPSEGFWPRLGRQWFPNAVVMAGYGNSLVGMCPQLNRAGEEPPEYFPHGTRVLFHIHDPDSRGRGRVGFHRLDESYFLPNVIERDEAQAVRPSARAMALGFQQSGLRDPRPAAAAPIAQGLY